MATHVHYPFCDSFLQEYIFPPNTEPQKLAKIPRSQSPKLTATNPNANLLPQSRPDPIDSMQESYFAAFLINKPRP